MKTNKLIIYQILILITIINTFYIYFANGLDSIRFTKSFFLMTYQGLIPIFLLWIIGLLVTISYVIKRVIIKKNLLKISSIILLILLSFSIIGRIREIIYGTFCLSCWTNTILYLILTVLTITILKDLY